MVCIQPAAGITAAAGDTTVFVTVVGCGLIDGEANEAGRAAMKHVLLVYQLGVGGIGGTFELVGHLRDPLIISLLLTLFLSFDGPNFPGLDSGCEMSCVNDGDKLKPCRPGCRPLGIRKQKQLFRWHQVEECMDSCRKEYLLPRQVEKPLPEEDRKVCGWDAVGSSWLLVGWRSRCFPPPGWPLKHIGLRSATDRKSVV